MDKMIYEKTNVSTKQIKTISDVITNKMIINKINTKLTINVTYL